MHEKPVDSRVVRSHFDALAADYDAIKRKNSHYHELLKRFIAETVPPGRRVLEIGTATGEILRSLSPSLGVGIDISPKMIELARAKYPDLRFEAASFEHFEPKPGESFEFIVLADVIEHVESAESLFRHLARLASPGTTVVVTMANPAWEPFLELLEKCKLKMEEGPHFRVSESRTLALAAQNGFRTVSRRGSVFVPVRLGRAGRWLNRLSERAPWDRAALIVKITLVKT